MQILISYNKVQLLSENYLVYMRSNSILITTLGTVSFTYVICDQTGKIFFPINAVRVGFSRHWS